VTAPKRGISRKQKDRENCVLIKKRKPEERIDDYANNLAKLIELGRHCSI
jgi:hypothetical protein